MSVGVGKVPGDSRASEVGRADEVPVTSQWVPPAASREVRLANCVPFCVPGGR